MLSRHDPHAPADGASIRFRANTFHLQPVIFRGAVISQQRRRFVHIDDDYVDVAIIIEVPESRTAAGARLGNDGASLGGDVGEASIPQVSVENPPLLKRKVELPGIDFGEYVAVRHKYVRPPIVIEVEQANSPSQIPCVAPKTALQHSVVKRPIPTVVIQV